MESSKSNEQLLLNDVQIEKVLICFLREVLRGDLKSIDQTGWENFEVLRVSAKARLKWGIDMCVQMLQAANTNMKIRKNSIDKASPNHKRISATHSGLYFDMASVWGKIILIFPHCI